MKLRIWVRELLVLSLLVLIAFGLRLYNLDAFGFWTDEGLTPLRSGYAVSQIFSNHIFIQEAISTDTHPPLYYLLIHFTRILFGESDFGFRFPSLLAGVLLIPLLYQFGRRLGGKRVGLVVAGLTAVNPLQIYYANEARMYTLFVLLMAAASYVLWRMLQQREMARPRFLRHLLLYMLLAGLAFYTHYFAVILIAAQGLFLAWLLWQNGYKKLLIGTAVAAILLAIPLIPFIVPRLFTGAEANYYYVPPRVMLQDVVHFFNLGLSSDFDLLWVKLVDVAALLLLFLGVWSARSNLQRAFLLSYLLAVVFGLMAGSLIFKPMYQGVRHIMVSSPAFLLLLGLGTRGIRDRGLEIGKRAIPNLQSLISNLFFIVILSGSILSVRNLFFNPAFVKDDFRQMIRYIEQQAGGRDVVVYNNAVLLPLHDHYRVRQDVAVTALPIYPYMVDANDDSGLRSLTETYDRIWFVTDPPADGRDADKFIAGWLAENLQVVGGKHFPARTTSVETIGYGTAPTPSHLPQNSTPLDIQWQKLPQLMGIQLNFEQPTALPTLWLNLFWQGGEAPTPDAALRLTLRGEDGAEWLAYEQSFWSKKADPVWPESGLKRLSYNLPMPIGMPPGTYQLLAQTFEFSDGAALGEPEFLAEISLAANSERMIVAGDGIRFENGVQLADIEVVDNKVRPGHTLPLHLFWQIETAVNLQNLQYEFELLNSDGEPINKKSSHLGADWLDAWPLGATVRENKGLYIRPDTPPGRYRLRWRLTDGDQVIPGRPTWRPWASPDVILGEFEVIPWPIETELPEVAHTSGAQFGAAIQLYGYDFERVPEGLGVELVWQVTAVPQVNDFIFLHLVSAADGSIVSQRDVIPVQGLRQTAGWRAGEVLIDEHLLPLPEDLPAGTYHLNIGFFDADSFERLPVVVDNQPQPDGQLRLFTITLP